MTVYVDTSALLALIHRDDAAHAAVTAEVRRLTTESHAFVTTSYTLVETAALVQRRLGAAAFRALGETAQRALEVVWVDEELHQRGWTEAVRQGRGGPSLVDCVAFAAMRALDIETALAVDAHFRRAGFRVVP